MKELKELYDSLISKLSEEHESWVNSNHKLRSIESARMQLKTDGYASNSPVFDILNEAYEKERAHNECATVRMYARKDFLREIEIFAEDHGEEWNGTFDVFGY